MRKRMGALFLTAALLVQPFGSVANAANESRAADLPEPVFAMDFENLQQDVEAKISGTFTATTKQEITVHNNVTVQEGRNGGKALLLDNTEGNSGHLTMMNTAELNPSSLTASFWLKRVSPLKDEGRIFWSKKSKTWNSNGWVMGWTGTDERGEAMALLTDGENMARKMGNPAEVMPEGTWSHIVGTFDAATGTMKVYQNGVEIASNTVSGASITREAAADVLQIGNSGYGTEGIGAVIDDVCIYNQVLSSEQIGQMLDKEDHLVLDAQSLTVPERVGADFTLALQGANGSQITWESDSPQIVIGDGGQVTVTRGDSDTVVNLTAKLSYQGHQGKPVERTFPVTVLKKNESVEGLQKLSYDEIIDVGGTVGTRLKDMTKAYAMDYLYGQKMDKYLSDFKAHTHSGWSWLEGEQAGKWLETMANFKWMDQDGSVKTAITSVVDRLAESQTTENKSAKGYNKFGGYLGNATASIREKKPVKGMDPYEMYSLLNGLLMVYRNYRQDAPELASKSMDCARKLADYLVATIGDESTKVPYADGTLSDMDKVEFWPLCASNGITNSNGVTIAGHDVHQGWEGSLLIDPMMQLSQVIQDTDAAGSQKYSDWVDWVVGNIDKWASSWKNYGDTPYADLDKVAAGEKGIHEIQHYVHAHTFQMNFLGFLRKYQETGETSYLRKVAGAWNDITSRQMYITGTVSVGEHYDAGHNLPNTGDVGETCATNSWSLLNNNLFELTQEEKYQQVVEDLLFNHMFATTTIDGDGNSYHRPLNGTTDRFYTGPDCCSSSGMRMQSYVPYYLYSKSDTEVYVNQFVTNEVKIKMKNGTMHLKQTTDYPETDTISLKVEADSVGGILNVRVPGWVKNPTIKVNGTAVTTAVTAGAYTKINVSPGDALEITYPSELTWVKGDNSNQGSWAMKKGPMVYCLASAFMSQKESQEAFDADIARVTAAAVLNAEDGKAVKTEGSVDFGQERILGKGYRIKMNTTHGVQIVTVVPYANIGQWYRIGDTKPSDYSNAVRYPYQTWISEELTDYPSEPDPEMTPIVKYDFDTMDGTTVKDVSNHGKDASGKGQATIAEGGKFGKYLKLNGSDAYVQLPNDILYGLYNMTVSVWVNPDELSSWARIFDFGSKSDPPYPNLFLTVNSGSNNLRLAYEESKSPAENKVVGGQVNAGAALKTGQWQHVCTVIDGAKATLYVDGRKVAENVGFQFNPVKTKDMISNMLGKSNYGSDKLFKGGMDDFRIYNRILSEKEVGMLQNGEEPIKYISTVATPDNVETTVGNAPILPNKASVSYDDGTNGRERIVWDEIPKEKYETAGSFEVKGKVGTFDITITVVVKGTVPPPTPPAPVSSSVESVKLDKSEVSLEIGESVTLKAEVSPANAVNKAVNWKSSDPMIAEVDVNGRVTAKAPGQAAITVVSVDGGKKASCVVSVKAPAIKLNYKSLPLQRKKSTTVVKITSASVKGEKIKSATSSKPKIASVKVKKGKLQIKGRKIGRAVITVVSTHGGKAKISINVKKKVSVSKLSMSKKKYTVKKGKKLRLTVTKKPVTATNKISFRSSDERIVSVSSKGVVKGKKKGKVTVTAVSSNGKKASCKITVK